MIHCRHYRRRVVTILLLICIKHIIDIECDSCPFKEGNNNIIGTHRDRFLHRHETILFSKPV